MANAARKQNEETFNEFVSRIVRECNGDKRKAEEKAFSILQKNHDALRAMVRIAMHHGVNQGVRNAYKSERREIFAAAVRQWGPPAGAIAANRNAARASVAVIARSLLDFPLNDGIKLRDAKRTQIVKYADHLSAQAGTMAHRARWLALIAQSLPDDKKCGDVVTDERAAELFKEAA